MIYLNHAGTSWPKPEPVRRAVADASGASPSDWPTRFEAAHHAVAGHFRVAPEALLITPGCTQALAVALADVPWQPGDRALTSSLEHHALMRPLAKLRGVDVQAIGRDVQGPLDLKSLERALASGGVRLVALSMASNVTGELLPFRKVVDLAHAYGALCLLDGAQVAGWMALDLPEIGADLFAFAGHKGPQAPTGVGGLYVRPGLFLDTPAAACEGEVCRPGPGYCDTGSVSLPGLCGLAAGLAWMANERPLARARAAETAFREAIQRLPRVRVVGGDGPRLPTCSLVVDGHRPSELARGLAARGVIVRGGTHCAPAAHDALGTGSEGTLRFSFGPSHPATDAAAASDALRELLA